MCIDLEFKLVSFVQLLLMEVSTNDVYLIIETLRRNQYKATDIHQIITTAWGKDTISIRQVQRLSKEFAKRMTVELKFLVLMAINFSGLHHYQILERNETVNSEIYTHFLDDAMQSFNTYDLQVQKKSISWDTCILLQDNARPHVSNQSRQFFERKHCKLLKQPVYSPDVNICDRMLFPKLEMKRSKLHFYTSEDLRQFLDQELATLNPELMSHEFDMLQIHLKNIIDHNGNFV